MMRVFSLLIVCTLMTLPDLQAGEQFVFSRDSVISRLQLDIYTLASEELEGREAGTPGEHKAVSYIASGIMEAGLEPLFDGSYRQEFPFPGEWVWGPDNYLTYQDSTFEHGMDYYALPGSASGEFTGSFVHVNYGLTDMDDTEGYEDYCDYALVGDVEGSILIMEFYLPADLDSLVDMSQARVANQKIRLASEKGAAGIIFVNTKTGYDDPPIDLRVSRRAFDIPLLFADDHVLHHMMRDQDGRITMEVDLDREENTGTNVAGYIDNDADYTVVIGGHHDHVGYGGQGSREPGLHAIHYGADDNASGTAGVLEMARRLQQSDMRNYNYLFITFSAEEKGLIGSRHFVDSEAYDMDRVNYMFNLDMIGRLEEHTLSLIGTGSSPAWDDLIDDHAPEHFTIRKRPGGRGGSDHTAFYVKDIPVIFFFTGIHDDYHLPADTPDKINYEGTYEVLSLVEEMITTLDGRERLAFSSTSSGQERDRPSRADMVTLGLMPDHAYDGEGMRVMAVTDDEPAHKAAMKEGDVIIQINDMEVRDIYSYMEVMGNLSEGEEAEVLVVRGEEEILLTVEL